MSNIRADALIVARQKKELKEEAAINSNVSESKVVAKCIWENKTNGMIINNQVKMKVSELEARRKSDLDERRRKLSVMLTQERTMYETELKEREETPGQRMDKMAQRGWELKKRREDERKKLVQEKLYQQWRSSMDELRTADSKLFELETMAARDWQVEEKQRRSDMDDAERAVYDALWQEGYMAKVEREERENALKAFRNAESNDTLDQQVAYKRAHEASEREQLLAEKEAMRDLWEEADKEQREQAEREKIAAAVERKKVDAFMYIQKADREATAKEEKDQDRQFVQSVLAKERVLAEKEEADRQRAIAQAAEFNEALKVEMARKAETEADLIRLQNEEAERQWQKRYKQWEAEELARRNLMQEVYDDRAMQVQMKTAEREHAMSERFKDADRIKADMDEQEYLEQEKQMAEALLRKRHQEELFRQMDFHQVQRHRELQQHAIEQRQAMIAEEKLQRALEAEKRKQQSMAEDIFSKRAEAAAGYTVTAPWDK
jgi:hypothetical protein